MFLRDINVIANLNANFFYDAVSIMMQKTLNALGKDSLELAFDDSLLVSLFLLEPAKFPEHIRNTINEKVEKSIDAIRRSLFAFSSSYSQRREYRNDDTVNGATKDFIIRAFNGTVKRDGIIVARIEQGLKNLVKIDREVKDLSYIVIESDNGTEGVSPSIMYWRELATLIDRELRKFSRRKKYFLFSH